MGEPAARRGAASPGRPAPGAIRSPNRARTAALIGLVDIDPARSALAPRAGPSRHRRRGARGNRRSPPARRRSEQLDRPGAEDAPAGAGTGRWRPAPASSSMAAEMGRRPTSRQRLAGAAAQASGISERASQARARILAALGVVGRRRDHGVRPVARPRRMARVEMRPPAMPNCAGIAADLVQREQRGRSGRTACPPGSWPSPGR